VPTVTKTVKLPDPLNERLRNYCFTRNLTQQDVFLQAIENYLEEAAGAEAPAEASLADDDTVIPMFLRRRKAVRHVPLQSAHQDYLAARERNRRTIGTPAAKRGKPIIDLTGQKFGHLTVLSLVPREQWSSASAWWWVQCDCPKQTRKKVSSNALRTGRTQSCGCIRGRPRTQGAFEKVQRAGEQRGIEALS
jgi:hypothetical protein